MPATISTLPVPDANGTSRDVRAVDVSGTGAGPWAFLHVLSDKTGTAIDTGNALPVNVTSGGISSGTANAPAAAVLSVQSPYTVKTAIIAASASGDNSVVAAVSAKKIRVLGFFVTGNGAVNVKFRSGTTDISGLTYIAQAGGGIAVPSTTGGFWFETATNTVLNINLSAAVAVGGQVQYAEI